MWKGGSPFSHLMMRAKSAIVVYVIALVRGRWSLHDYPFFFVSFPASLIRRQNEALMIQILYDKA